MYSDRQIYTFPDGRKGDPLALQRRLFLESKGFINDWIEARGGEDPLAAAVAEESLLAATRSAFGYLSFDQGGALDEQVLDDLDSFTGYLTAKKAKGQTTLDSTPCSDCPPLSPTMTELSSN
jgi:hypothetical protein